MFLVVEEGWKLTASAAAGAWLNEYARRSRHYALWLIFVSQFFRDLATAQGYALLENKAIALCFQNDADDLEHARAPLSLTDADIEHITTLTTRPGLYSSAYMISNRGRGTVRQLLGDLEYWICCSDPENDQPRRAAALRADRRGPLGRAQAAVHARVARAIPRARTSRMTSTSERSHKRRWLLWLPAAGGFMLIALPVVLLGGVGSRAMLAAAARSAQAPPAPARGSPPPTGRRGTPINGSGVTATGLNLTAGPPAYEIAVDPAVIPLQTFAHVQPNPFGTTRAFYAGDTGGAIIGRHVDIYDWKGRADQNAWGVRHVNVTPAPNPGAGNLLQEITPGPTTIAGTGQVSATAGSTAACDQLAGSATLATVPGQAARILADGTAAAPSDAPPAVKLAIAAANEIHTKPYPEPVAHFGSLASSMAGVRLLGRGVLRPLQRGPAQPIARRVRDARKLGLPGPGQLDHRLRQLQAHLDRRRRARVRHRRLRRPEHPRRQRPPMAAGPAREPRRRTDLCRPTPTRPMTPEQSTRALAECFSRARARETRGRNARRPARRGRARRLRWNRRPLPDQRHRHAHRLDPDSSRRRPIQAIPRQSATEPSQPVSRAATARPQRHRGTQEPAGGADPLRGALRQLDRRRRRRQPAAAGRDLSSARPERRRSKPPRASPATPSSPRARSRTRAPSSRSPRVKEPQPDSGCSSPASRPPGGATTPDCRRPSTSSTPS